MSPLAAAADAYLKMRRALGFKLYHETWLLPDFVAFVEAQGGSTVTTALAIRWAQQPAGTGPRWWTHRLAAVRGFAKHYRAFDPRTEIPECHFPRQRRLSPHLYSEAEVPSLLDHARRLRDPILSSTYSTLLALLAAPGCAWGRPWPSTTATSIWSAPSSPSGVPSSESHVWCPYIRPPASHCSSTSADVTASTHAVAPQASSSPAPADASGTRISITSSCASSLRPVFVVPLAAEHACTICDTPSRSRPSPTGIARPRCRAPPALVIHLSRPRQPHLHLLVSLHHPELLDAAGARLEQFWKARP